MSNSSEESRPAQTPATNLADHIRKIPGACQTFPAWCDEGPEPHTEHHGTPDMPPVTATGERSAVQIGVWGGADAPRVSVAIWCDRTFEPKREIDIDLTLTYPDGRDMDVHMTVSEADFLRRHLVQAIRAARS